MPAGYLPRPAGFLAAGFAAAGAGFAAAGFLAAAAGAGLLATGFLVFVVAIEIHLIVKRTLPKQGNC